MPSHVQEADDAELEDILARSDRVVVVEYYTNSCPICRSMAPMLDATAEQLADRAVFVKVNVQLHQVHASLLGIQGVPTFVFYCGGKPLGLFAGATHPVVFKNTIEDLVRHRKECGALTKVSFDSDAHA